jgi:TRAP-type C4-dicarboxylate transport system substrate-binding protein
MRFPVIAAVLATAILASGTASAQEVRLRGGVFVPLTSAFGSPCKRFVDELNEKGKGQVQMQLLGPEAMPPFELANAVSGGVLDFICVPPAYYKGKMAESEAIYFTNIPFTEHRKSGAYEALNKFHNEKMNAQYLTSYGDGVRFHFYLNRDNIKGPEDFKGLKIRSAPNYDALLVSLGATPVAIPPGEVYTALERGTVDGYGWPFWGIHDLGWDKYTKVRVDPGFHNVAVTILMNLPKYKSLNAAQKKVVDDTALWLETSFPSWRDEITATDMKKQQASGIKAVDFGPAWRKRADDTYLQQIEKNSPENINALRKLLVK